MLCAFWCDSSLNSICLVTAHLTGAQQLKSSFNRRNRISFWGMKQCALLHSQSGDFDLIFSHVSPFFLSTASTVALLSWSGIRSVSLNAVVNFHIAECLHDMVLHNWSIIWTLSARIQDGILLSCCWLWNNWLLWAVCSLYAIISGSESEPEPEPESICSIARATMSKVFSWVSNNPWAGFIANGCPIFLDSCVGGELGASVH